jgi:hypothetical protein
LVRSDLGLIGKVTGGVVLMVPTVAVTLGTHAESGLHAFLFHAKHQVIIQTENKRTKRTENKRTKRRK